MVAVIARRQFKLGRIVATPAALEILKKAGRSANEFLDRHARCDWGDISKSDWFLNDQAIEEGDRILSSYELETGQKIWVITEADRSSTCVLLPEDY